MTEPFEKPFLAPTLAHWEKRLTLLAVALIVLELLDWGGSLWSLTDAGITKSGFVAFAFQVSTFWPFLALILALLPDMISGQVRFRGRGLTFVLVVAVILGVVDAILNLVAAALTYGDQFLGRNQTFFDHLSHIGFPLMVAALAVTGLSDSRFVPRLGGFRPPPPRPDSDPLPG